MLGMSAPNLGLTSILKQPQKVYFLQFGSFLPYLSCNEAFYIGFIILFCTWVGVANLK